MIEEDLSIGDKIKNINVKLDNTSLNKKITSSTTPLDLIDILQSTLDKLEQQNNVIHEKNVLLFEKNKMIEMQSTMINKLSSMDSKIDLVLNNQDNCSKKMGQWDKEKVQWKQWAKEQKEQWWKDKKAEEAKNKTINSWHSSLGQLIKFDDQKIKEDVIKSEEILVQPSINNNKNCLNKNCSLLKHT